MAELSPERQAQLDALRARLEAEETREDEERRAAQRQLAGAPLVIDAPLKTDPMIQQVAAMNVAAALFRGGEPGAGLLMEQGTGKSLVALGLVGAMAKRRSVNWGLIVCPNSLKGTWADPDPEFGEISRHSSLDADVIVLDGPRAKRIEDARRQLIRAKKSRTFAWVVTNIDQFSARTFEKVQGRDIPTSEFQAWLSLLKEAPPAALVLDEASTVKINGSRRSRAIRMMAPEFRYRMILTGTPVTRSPLDVWAQFEVLKPGALGHYTFLAFERYYAQQALRTMKLKSGSRTFVENVGYRADRLEELERRVGLLSYRCRASDCLDLPPVIERRIAVEISPEQQRTVQELKTDMMALLDSGLVDGRNILTRYQRMAQVLGGFVPTMDADGNPTGIKHAFEPNPKLRALEEYLSCAFDDYTHKGVVFCLYRPEIAAVMAQAERQGWQPVEIHGDVSGPDREANRKRFAGDPACRLIVCQYQTGSFGLNLVAANHLILFSPTFNLEHYLQALKRVHRKGQERQVNQVLLIAVPRRKKGKTLDHLIYTSLGRKQDFADAVTGDARAERERLAEL